MATQRLSITDLYQGTSFQHPSRRRQGQVEKASNIRLDIADGAARRNGTDFIAKLDIPFSDWYVTSFQSRWIVFISSLGIRVFDSIDGSEREVINKVGDYQYLSGTVADDIRTGGILDSLLILNRNIVTEFTTSEDYEIKDAFPTFDKLFEPPEDGVAVDYDPTLATDGDKVEILDPWKATRAGFYEKSTDSVTGKPIWTMIPPPNSKEAIPNSFTLPHRLVYEEVNGNFIYDSSPWRPRLSGSEDTNPAPSWANHKIDALTSVQGRFVIIGNQAITLSEIPAPRRSAFNFYGFEVGNETDADRIDINITSPDIGRCFRAEEAGADLALICESGIVTFTAGNELLSSSTARDFVISNIPAKENVRPGTAAGQLFVMDNNNRISWFSWQEGLRPFGKINDHRPDILDNTQVLDMFAIEQTLYVLTNTDVKVHERYVTTEGNQQSAWSDIKLIDTVIHVHGFRDKTKIITYSEDRGYSLLNYEHQRPRFLPNLEYEICLDRRELVQGMYNEATDETSFTHSYSSAVLTDSILVVTKLNDGTLVNQPMQPLRVSNNRFFVSGDFSAFEHYIGYKYDSELRLTKIWAGSTDINLMLSQINVIYKDSTDYILNIEGKGRPIERKAWSSSTMGVAVIGEVKGETDLNKHLVLGKTKDTDIVIRSSSAGYFIINAIEYRVRPKGKR